MKLDTKDKIRQAQQKLIQDSRTIIKGIQTYKGSYTRQGLTRSIHHNTFINPPTPSQIYNAYTKRIPTKYLLNAISLELTFDNIPIKQHHAVLHHIKGLVTGLGYKLVKIQHTIAPVEIRFVNTEIPRHEAKVHTPRATNSGGTSIRVDLCDYAVRPCYQSEKLLFDQRPECVYMESFKVVREHTLQKLRMPVFDDNGYYSGFEEVDRAFYDNATGIQPPKLYHDCWEQGRREQVERMAAAREALGLAPFQRKSPESASVCS